MNCASAKKLFKCKSEKGLSVVFDQKGEEEIKEIKRRVFAESSKKNREDSG